MVCKVAGNKMSVIILALMSMMTLGCNGMLSKQNTAGQKVRLEHVALNVKDPVSMASWYSANLGMKVIRKGNPPVNAHFIADADGNMMLEIYNNQDVVVPDYSSMNTANLHIAFMVEDVEAIRKKLTAAGATIASDITTADIGDKILMLRDPWGVPIQFIKRAKPMLELN
jgi:catechol 2,3-dioxygenase-like lactoylglutathione lyase family enzyme